MKIWRNTPLDGIKLGLSILQLLVTLYVAARWRDLSISWKIAGYCGLVFMMAYNVIIISHMFNHVPWFESKVLNRLVSMLNTVNIWQSLEAYRITHVRNHHRYNNDRKAGDARPKDWTSTFLQGRNGEHCSLIRYTLVNAFFTLTGVGKELLLVRRLWKVGPEEAYLFVLASKDPDKRAWELRQVQLDRMAQTFSTLALLLISWQFTLFCYLPAVYAALALVNVQNYYEHYGAVPENRYADSSSYYGKLYNLLTFNDGYHQEHHLRPQTHWSKLPQVRQDLRVRLDSNERIISPVPAILGFLHFKRPLLHRRSSVPPDAALAALRQE